MKSSDMRITKGILTFTLLTPLLIWAQKPNELIEQYSTKYPGQAQVGLQLHEKVEFYFEDDQLIGKHTVKETDLHLEAPPSALQIRSLYSSGFRQMTEWDAYALNPKSESKYKKLPVKVSKEYDDSDRSIFHDDLKVTQLEFNELTRGSQTHVASAYALNDMHLLPSFRINPFMPVEDMVFEIVSPEEVELIINLYAFDGVEYRVEEDTKGSNRILRYIVTEAPRVQFESNGPPVRYYTPTIHVRVAGYSDGKGEQQFVLRNTDDLHSWYCGFLAESAKGEDLDRIKEVADSITAGITNPNEQARMIFEWVQQNIRYVAIEDGYNGYIPDRAISVCDRRFGDCKGLSNLLVALLRSKDITAHHVWVGTSDIPYSYEEFASPAVDNHMIAQVELPDTSYFLDATSPYIPFGYPSQFTQGQEAFVDLDCKDYRIELIPTPKPELNALIDSVWTHIEGGVLSGKGKLTVRGYQRGHFENLLEGANERRKRKIFRSLLEKGSNKFMLDTLYFENLDDRTKSLIVHYTFDLPNHALQMDDETIVNMSIEEVFSKEAPEPDREVGLSFKFLAQYRMVHILDIEKWEIDYLPEATDFTNSTGRYKSNYSVVGNKLIYDQQLDQYQLMVSTEDLNQYTDLANTISNSLRQQIIIKPNP